MNETDACYRCDYNLTGIADDQPCPECGLLAARSRRSTDELHEGRPRWLRKLSQGVWLTLVAGVSPVALYPLLGGILLAISPNAGSLRTEFAQVIMMSPLYVTASLICIGMLLLTAKEGHPPTDLKDQSLRIFLRFASAAPLIALLFWQASMHVGTTRSWVISLDEGFSPLELSALFVATIGTTPLPILIGLRLRGLAKRVHSDHLAEHCLIVGIGVALTLVYMFIYTMIDAHAEKWGLGGNFTGGKTWLIFSLIVGVISGLMVLWNAYLLIRFAIAFGSAAGKLRAKWATDDRSQLSTTPHI